MKKMMKRWIGLAVCLFLAALVIVPQVLAANAPAITVGRVYYIEGDLLRYIPEDNDWVAMVKDAPFGAEDALFSGNTGMAETIVPNGTWMRVGNSTQIQIIALASDLTEMDVAAGVARFYNKGSETIIKATSPFGYVLAYPGAVFDFYVGENSVEVIAVEGTVSFVHTATDARYDVVAGSPSILADASQASSGDGTIDPDWDRWNNARENFWMSKARIRGRSVEYLPPDLQDESYALEENGRWENVPYEGSSHWFWRPTTVAVGWSPFTAGRWTDWNGDQVWIPAEPFGYVTHHYGNWVYTRNSWYWAPPVVSVQMGRPLLDIGFFWSPGRVSWIYHDTYVGWVPLAPRETYYSHRNWGGPHTMVVTNNITRINVNIGSYAYASHAIVVPRDNFYRVDNYRNVRMTNMNSTAIINNYKAAPVVNNTVINNYTTNKQRHNFTNIAVKEKPHNTVINRIEKNTPVIQKSKKENAAVVRQQVKSIKVGKVNRETRIEAPKSTNYIVPNNEVNRPKSKINLQQREIKTGGKPGQPSGPERVIPARPERVAPVKPNQQEKSLQPSQPERVIPARPERVAPVRPSQQEKSLQPARPERVIPARPERVAPAKPSQQEKSLQPARPERVIPARPERVAPVKPTQQEKSLQPARPERVIPAEQKDPRKMEKQIEKPREQRPVQKQIKKPKELTPSEKEAEKRREGNIPENEREKPRQ